jgi:hypothetical protein
MDIWIVYQLVPVPPSPLVSWNHRVRRKSWLWSLILNDLEQSIPEPMT